MKNCRTSLAAASVFVFTIVTPCVGQTGSCAKFAGTWRIVRQSLNGQAASDLGKTQTHLKHVTDTHFTWVTYNNDTKQVTSALGGTCVVDGDSYVETPQYGLGQVVGVLKDKPQKFTARLEDGSWHLSGQLSSGQKLDEVWERVKE